LSPGSLCEELTYVVCHAVPTSMDVTSIASRGDTVLVPGLYGKSGGPEIDDLITGESA
jgi:hypothetical protein